MRRVVMVLFVVGVATASICSGTRSFADESESLEGLRNAKLNAAQDWWRLLVEKAKAGSPDASPREEFRAAETLKNAQLDVAKNQRERIRALQEHRDRVQSVYDMVETLTKVGANGGEPGKLAEARIHLLDAKIRLKEEEGK